MLPQPLEQTLPLRPLTTKVDLPLVINEGLIDQFNYWNQGVQRGMRHQKELYAYFQAYSSSERLNAYAIACEQADLNLSVCVTVSKVGYTIWLNLRSLNTSSTDD